MATQREERESSLAVDRDAPLTPLHGFLCPGVCFPTGHCLWLLKFSSTPTAIGAYGQVWLVTPEGERLLYTDPAEAQQYVQLYHDFDRTAGGTITWDRADEDCIEMQLDGEDGTTLSLRVDLGSSTSTRLLNGITSLTPQFVLRSSFGESVSNLCLSRLMDANGMKVAGVTEVEEPYRVEADSLRVVESASATLNGEDLGESCPPDRPIEFGDARVPNDPFVSFGGLCVHPPDD